MGRVYTVILKYKRDVSSAIWKWIVIIIANIDSRVIQLLESFVLWLECLGDNFDVRK